MEARGGALEPCFEPVLPPEPPEIVRRNLSLELVHLVAVQRSGGVAAVGNAGSGCLPVRQ
jgi:hypothetical protein